MRFAITRLRTAPSRYAILTALLLTFSPLLSAAQTAPFRVKDINSGSGSSDPQNFAFMGSGLFFSASDGTSGGAKGTELWKTDGTATGTVLVKDINSGTASSNPANLTAVGSTLFFAATDGSKGVELWKSNGTPGNASMVMDINSGSANSSPTNLLAIGSTLFFSATDGTSSGLHGRELWMTDGTTTSMVKDINNSNSGTASSNPSFLTNFGGMLFFAATTSGSGIELWKSDGTGPNTTMVKEINASSASASPSSLVVANGMLFFAATDGMGAGMHGRELWKSDGTTGNTVLVSDINPGVADSSPANLTAVGNTVFFAADDGSTGMELWKTDGTTTARVADINPGAAGSNPQNLTDVNGTLYFRADDGTTGVELWKTDGTTTSRVADINPGGDSFPSFLVNVGGKLFFSADDGSSGGELWTSDGTTTARVADINSGAAGSNPFALTAANGSLFFRASDGSTGNELWALLGNCGDGVIGFGEECDDGNTTNGDCCSSSCHLEPATTVCRQAAGVCDLPEMCTGTSPSCPADVKSTAVCRAPIGLCDAPESCDGFSNDCPPDALEPSGFQCRSSAGACDVAETCDGLTIDCPTDVKSTAVCRPVGGPCDAAESCNGVSNTCPADGFLASTVQCRAAAGVCDLADFCPGNGPACPTDAKSTGVCRPVAGACDVAESCDGATNGCPADAVKSAGTSCRPSAAHCDAAETCNGSSAVCPADTGVLDADADGICDGVDNCPTIANADQKDTDHNGVGDACEPCTNGVAATTPKLTIGRLNTVVGDDTLSLAGNATLPYPFAPPLDPVNKGLRVVVKDASGASIADATAPKGAYDHVKRTGWKTNRTHTLFTYSNPAGGVFRGSVRVMPRTHGLLHFTFGVKKGNFPMAPSMLPLSATVVLDAPIAAGGQCAQLTFPGNPPVPGCNFFRRTQLRCK